jgi:hypothetical protein
MSLTLAYNAMHEPEPIGVVKTKQKATDEPSFQPKRLIGKWLRVFPQNGHDVQFLQNLEHGVDKHAPASGHGVLIAARCLPTPIRNTV